MKLRRLQGVIIAVSVFVASITAPTPILSALEQTKITRSQAEQRALNMINLKWTYTNSKNSNVSSTYTSSVAQASQLNGLTTAQMTGIPYNWGGVDGLDASSYNTPWDNFLGAVSKGAYVGNVKTDAGFGYIPNTAGLDCSGFVQQAFDIKGSKISTTTIFNKYFKKITLDEIKHMDILNKPGHHAVIFDKWGTKNGVYGAYTYESTVDKYYGGIQGTKRYFRSMRELNSGYIPGRYINISENIAVPNQTATLKTRIYAQVVNVQDWAYYRSSPSVTSSSVGKIPKGTFIYLSGQSAGWYKISYNGKTGWIYSNLVGEIPSGKYVTPDNIYQLNMRTLPSGTSTIVAIMDRGDFAEVVGISADGKWFKLKFNGAVGWSVKQYLSYIY